MPTTCIVWNMALLSPLCFANKLAAFCFCGQTQILTPVQHFKPHSFNENHTIFVTLVCNCLWIFMHIRGSFAYMVFWQHILVKCDKLNKSSSVFTVENACGISELMLSFLKYHTYVRVSDYDFTDPYLPDTVKPVYNDDPMGYFSAFWSSSRWPRAT